MPKNKYDCHVSSIKNLFMKNDIKNLQYIPINWQKTIFEKIYIPRISLIATDFSKTLDRILEQNEGKYGFLTIIRPI